ncbi:unnamed protein product [Caenorhabditis angaria]|uniref:Ig-like domain-containing protein n=1 Tax=Caenorhabditis angaria TaxID=860376 RepID=A0A9P1ID56_9PELO|nr:unnamed protein product [Caenorhabditis angaria]
MAFSLFSVVSLSVIYRLTINFPELPYTGELKNVESEEFLKISGEIVGEIHRVLEHLNVDGKHLARVSDYRYHNVIGTLVNVDIYFEKENPLVSDAILSAIKNGYIGSFKVSDEGFELHVVRDSETSCGSSEFTCLDKTCIPADQRCDGRRDCPDGSDEHKHHAKCKQHQPIIHQTQKIVFTPRNESVHLSATVENSDQDTVINWYRGEVLLGVGQVTVIEDKRIRVYQKGEKHYLMIKNVTTSDDGTYRMLVKDMNVHADFEIRITADFVPQESDDCPSGQRACKSGHCIPVSEFCDRRVQCPDGDDEFDCSEVQCKFNEFQCELSGICVPKVVECDGWRDCHDGSDEKNCTSSKKIYKPHHQKAKLNVKCHDGSEPEFSLHGSSYCWSNSVCPQSSECVHGLCCPISS